MLPCVVDHAADSYGPVLGALNNAVEDVEEAVFSPDWARPTERIYRLSRQVLEFRRVVAPLTELLDRLAAQSSTGAGERLKQRYRERRAHLPHLVELADGLGNRLQANLTEVSVRQNDDMRRISARCRPGHPDPADRHLREELPALAGARVGLWLPAGASGHGPHLHGLYRGFRRSGWSRPAVR